MKHLIYLFLPLLFSFSTQAQLTGHFDIGLGVQGDEESRILNNLSLGGGYSMLKNLYFFGGLELQTHYWDKQATIWDSEDDFEEKTIKLYTLSIYTGSRYSFNLFQFKEGAKFKHLGLFPEFRLYFDPWIPRKFSYYNDYDIVTQKGPFESQFSFGYGGGIFIGSIREAYFALKFEYRTADPYRTLRKMDYPGADFEFPGVNQYLLSLSILFNS